MHMADALISPAVGGTMLAATVGVVAYSIKKTEKEMDEKKIPLMGVMGAFVFAAQMINFTIPGTGSSGHLGGGMLLAILLGPNAGFLAMASILLIQALFFGDGGLLAYGCNVFNLGFYTCFIAYPFIYKKIVGNKINTKKIFIGAMVASIIGLQLGAFSVVLETVLSGKTELPFQTFLLLMQPIHLGIGIVEGLVTSAVVAFVWKARPEIIDSVNTGKTIGAISTKKVITVLIILTLAVGGILSWFASANPDGLEWSIEKVTGTSELKSDNKTNETLKNIQDKTAFLPDYTFKESSDKIAAQDKEEKWPAIDSGTTVSGIVGGALTLGLVILIAVIISLFKKRRKNIF